MQPAEGYFRALFSAAVTLTLAILGSSLLPVPYAFSKTGVLLGLLVMLVVAGSNCLTSLLLLKAAGKTGHDSYEGMALAIGGPTWKVLTQISLILLLFGTIVGDFALISDVSARAFKNLAAPDTPPAWLVAYDGRGTMCLFALIAVFPLCCLKGMRQLEAVATVGVVVILGVLAVIVQSSIHAGLPAIKSGELPLWKFQSTGQLPEAFVVLGFAFYLQPMMMPLLHDMPPGPTGLAITSTAVKIVILGVACVMYGTIGVFGAARFGQATEGDCLVNTWLGGQREGWMDLAMTLFLSISIPPMQISLRYTLDSLIAGEDAPFQLRRHMAETSGIVVSSLLVALIFPAYAEKIFAITGATAVCIVCYVIPVGLHFKMRANEKLGSPILSQIEQEQREVQALLLPNGGDDRDPDVHLDVRSSMDSDQESDSTFNQCWQTTYQVVLPVAVVLLGVSLSLAALFTTCKQLLA
ncbi:hypothetical protein ABBQ32_006491 [Trebouxia sp. C0010 RCD-2024]